MAKQVQIRRGPLSNLITLVEGELGFVTDTKELVVGASGGNQFMAKKTHQHAKADIVDFAHQHAKADIVDFAHQHDDRYYTQTEMNTLLGEKANAMHGHTLNYNYFYIGQVTSAGEHNFAAINNYQDFFIDIQVEWADGHIRASGIVSNHNVGVVNANIFDITAQAMCYLSASVHSGQLLVHSDGQMPWSMVTGETKYFSINLYGVNVS